MTSPSSYLFFDRNKPFLQLGAHFQRAYVTDDKITIYRKQFIRTRKAGVPFEQILGQTTYKLCTNKLGQKYLQILSRNKSAKFSDYALMGTLGLQTTSLYPECRDLLTKTLEGWLGSLSESGGISEGQAKRLLLPAYRDTSFPKLAGTFLNDLNNSTGMVTKALRDNDSWGGFVKSLCGDTVRTDSDVELLRRQPSLLRFAVMKLGTTISEFNSMANPDNDPFKVQTLSSMFTGTEYSCLAFMFKNLPKSDKEAGLRLMVECAKMGRDGLIPQNKQIAGGKLPYKCVPVRLRPKLAQVILASLSESHEQLTQNVALDVWPMAERIRTWFAMNVTMPSLQTELTVSDIKTRFTEILGKEYPEDAWLVRFCSADDLEFCTIEDRSRPEPIRPADVFTDFMNLVKPSQMKGLYSTSTTSFNGYMSEGEFKSLVKPIYSLDDLLAIVNEAAAELDRRLAKLGRDITPANRVSYLSFANQRDGLKERDYKNTWFYYDLGITEVEQIWRYKKAKLRSKKEVELYKELPEEMFNELTALAAGLKQEFLSYS